MRRKSRPRKSDSSASGARITADTPSITSSTVASPFLPAVVIRDDALLLLDGKAEQCHQLSERVAARQRGRDADEGPPRRLHQRQRDPDRGFGAIRGQRVGELAGRPRIEERADAGDRGSGDEPDRPPQRTLAGKDAQRAHHDRDTNPEEHPGKRQRDLGPRRPQAIQGSHPASMPPRGLRGNGAAFGLQPAQKRTRFPSRRKYKDRGPGVVAEWLKAQVC